MLRTRCPWLSDLSKLLQEKYQLRNESLAHNRSEDLMKVECDLIRVQKVITRHRLRCGTCKSQDSRATATVMRSKPVARESVQTWTQLAS
jgi:major membrane immunogen (membrane-anchored lipoprotein)